MSYRLDVLSPVAPEESGVPEKADHSRAVAEYLADMIGQLESMARVSGFELIVYLLAMARVEAETTARNSVDLRGPSKY
jgi:hypothetical protein